jgi:PhzF family phenazine biosynthesis protein
MRLIQIDAFTTEPFAGNPAAVCLLATPRDESWMQAVAREMNLSETAFLCRRAATDGPDAGFDLRWFTPSVEVALCGHATLASAHALWETGEIGAGQVARFHTKSGWLTAEPRDGLIELDFPATPAATADPPPGLADALGVAPAYVGKSRFDYLIEVDGEDVVRRLTPDIARIKTLPVRGVMVTSRATTAGWDFVSRFFAPAAGVDEDPVTGSAHCCLTPYWSGKLGKTEMTARQLSARGGTIHVRLAGDRVKLGGHAVTVMRGTLAESLRPVSG